MLVRLPPLSVLPSLTLKQSFQKVQQHKLPIVLGASVVVLTAAMELPPTEETGRFSIPRVKVKFYSLKSEDKE